MIALLVTELSTYGGAYRGDRSNRSGNACITILKDLTK